ncbi:MAG: DUF3016 domain-containing protein [Burkholderiales bacterium]|nr:DUF3016 domain-containing protein [Burkholderiales bacterium]
MTSTNAFTSVLFLALLGAWTSSSAAQADPSASAPAVRVEYLHPEKFQDIGEGRYGSDRQRTAHLEMLRKHIQQRAGRLLPEGQSLAVTITDVDMAGSFEPWRRYYDVRIVRDIYPPRIDLHFQLIDATGDVVKEGERKLRDMTFMTSSAMYRYSNDVLRYEKALLDDWLERDFRRG